MDLLENAVESIKVGVEDYQMGKHPRLLSAVRNIHAGILLLYKEVLRRHSPPGTNDVFVKARIHPLIASDGSVASLVGKGRKTATSQQIKERFGWLGLTTDWTRLEQIKDVRNDIEHYFATATQAALEGVISDACLITRDFVVRHLNSDPRLLLGDATWETMLDVAAVHEAEREACEKALDEVGWQSDALDAGVHHLSCTKCGSDLLRPEGASDVNYGVDVDLVCSACGAREAPEDYVSKAVSEALEGARYIAMTDGGDTPYVECPECFNEAYIIEEERCALCGHEAEHSCASCGSRIPPEELESSPLCGWCHHMVSKDD